MIYQSYPEVEQDYSKTKVIISKDISVYSIQQDEGMSGLLKNVPSSYYAPGHGL